MEKDVCLITTEIEKAGRLRARRQGESFSEVDFLCGAIAALTALGLEPSALWPLCLAAGRPVLQDPEAARRSRLWLEGKNNAAQEYRDLVKTAKDALRTCLHQVQALEEALHP